MSRGVHVPGWAGLRYIQTLANIIKQAHIQSNPSIGTSYPTHYSQLGWAGLSVTYLGESIAKIQV